MKRYIYYLLLSSIGICKGQVTITWDGGGLTNNFSDADNWSTNTVPTVSNRVVFDGTSTKNCTFDVAVSVLGMTINAGYSGVISGGSSAVTFTGSYVQGGGTFNATTDSLTIHDGNFVLTGGTFNHNSGIVVMRVSAGFTANISGTVTFDRLMLAARGATSSTQRTLNFGTSTTSRHFIAHIGVQRFLYQGSLSITSLLDVRSGVAPSGAHTATFTLGGSGNFSATTTAPNVGGGYLPTLVFNTTGNIVLSGLFSALGDWRHINGTFVPGTSTVYFFGNRTLTGSGIAFHHLTAVQSATLNFPSSAEVKVSGNLNFLTNSTANFPSTSLLGFNGVGDQYIQWLGGLPTISFGSIRVYTTAVNHRVTIYSSTGIANAIIQDSLKVDGGVTTQFRTDGKLTLRSIGTLNARVATLGTGASVVGNVTKQTSIPGGFTGWANLGVPGIMNQTVQNWDTYVSSGGTTGFPMTCTGCSYGPYEVLNGPFTSIQGWVEATNTYSNYSNTTALTPGIGHWVYVGNGQVNTSALTMVNTGSLVQGNVTIPVTRASTGYNLVANPYASPIRWSRVFASSTNISNEINIWNADLGVNTSCAGGICTHPATTGASDVIQAGQAFYVLANSGGGSVNFQESHKVAFNTNANPLLKPSGSSEEDGVFRLRLSDNYGYEDYTVFRTHPMATFGYDGSLDAHKILQSPGYAGYPGAYSKYTTISSRDDAGEDISINSIPVLTKTISIPVLVRVAISGTHKIEPLGLENFSSCVILKDKLTGTYHDLKSGPYSFTINDTTSTPRFELLMCSQRSANPNAISELLTGETVFVSQNDAGVLVSTHLKPGSEAKISARNLLGQKVMEDVTVTGEENLTILNLSVRNQVVIINVITDTENISKKVLVH